MGELTYSVAGMKFIDARNDVRNFFLVAILRAIDRVCWCMQKFVGQPMREGFHNMPWVVAARKPFDGMFKLMTARTFGRIS